VCGVIGPLPALNHLGGRRVGGEKLGEPAQGRGHGAWGGSRGKTIGVFSDCLYNHVGEKSRPKKANQS
jgi:hypothetical protein